MSSERNRVEEELVEAHRRTTAILESIADAFYSLDRGWRFVQVNPAAVRAPFGRPESELVGKVIWDVFPAIVGTSIEQRYLDAMEKQERQHYEARSPLNGRWYEVFMGPHQGGLDVYLRDIDDRKKTEEALRESEARLRAHIENSPLAVVEFDNEFRVTRWSEEAERLFGWTSGEILGRSILQMRWVHEEDAELVTRESAGLFTGERPRSLNVNRNYRKDGGVLECEWYNSAIYDSEGRLTSVMSLVRDVTELRHTERERERLLSELQRRTAELDATLSSMTTGVVIFGADGHRRYANQAAQDILHYTAEEQAATDVTIRTRLLSFANEDGSPIPLGETPAARALRGEASRGVIMRVPRPGLDVWISVSAAPIRGPEGELLGAVSVISDLTQRKQMETRADWLASFPERNPLPITEVSLSGEIHYVNPSARRLFPDLEEMRLEHGWLAGWQDMVRELRTSQREVWERTVRVGDAVYAQTLNLLPDLGSVRIYGRNITARTRMEQELVKANTLLREADQHKNEFLAMLSHELRNPLAPIHNSLHVLDRAEPGSEAALRARSIIGRQTAHITRLVDDLLDVTRISRGKVQLQRKVIDFCDIVRRTTEDLRVLFVESEITLEVDLPEAPLAVDGDTTRLAQTVGNLLHNALKFTDRGGRAWVTLTREQGMVVLRVRDTGVGIGQDMLPHLFEAFIQADRTLDRSRGGIGLGLALVKGLVGLHGGEVQAQSDGLGKGSEFVVRLPLVETDLVEMTVPRAVAAPQRRRVLVIEDNLDAAASLCEVLELSEHQVEVAHSGPEGVAKALAFKPDVVLCDIGLPGMDGYGVARALRADPSLKGVFLVALTGYALPEDLRRAQDAGFDCHLAKPPSLEKLEQMLQSPS